MTVSDILDALPRLEPDDRELILRRLMQFDAGGELAETPEMLAAIDAGIRSMDSGPGVPLEEARRRLAAG